MQCKYCGMDGFSSLKGLMGHRNQRGHTSCKASWEKERREQNDAKTKVECRICGQKLRNISNTHLKKHGISQQEYKERFHSAPMFADGLLDEQSKKRERSIVKRYGDQSIKASTIENFQRKYGQKEGKKRYEKWCSSVGSGLKNLQRKHGTKEGKRRHDEWIDSIQGRCTLDWYTERYGDEGNQLHQDACRNKSTGHLVQYYIDKYGKEGGVRVWNEICQSKALTLDNFVVKYGEEDGTRRYHELQQGKSGFCQSKVAVDLFNILAHRLLGEKVYYWENPKEYGLFLHDIWKYTFLDFFVSTKTRAIEFYGDYWHGNPILYPSGTTISYPNKSEVLVDSVWEADFERNRAVEREHGIPILVVWESEYRQDAERVVEECLSFVTS